MRHFGGGAIGDSFSFIECLTPKVPAGINVGPSKGDSHRFRQSFGRDAVDCFFHVGVAEVQECQFGQLVLPAAKRLFVIDER